MGADDPSRDRVLELGKLTPDDFRRIRSCRRSQNRLGFSYQLAFVRLANRFPALRPFEMLDDLVTFVAVQTDIPASELSGYINRQQTIYQHQLQIREYLGLRNLGESERREIEAFLFQQCCRLEQTSILRLHAKRYLRDHRILEPAGWTLDRLIGEQRRRAREHIFTRIDERLDDELRTQLDALLEIGDRRVSDIQALKEVPGVPSAGAMLRLTEKLDRIEKTGVLGLDLGWLNNNYQRALAKHARKCSAHRLRELDSTHRYASTVCFLSQAYQDTIDFIVDMQDKLLTRICSQAQREVDEALTRKRQSIQRSASILQKVAGVVLDDGVSDTDVRRAIFQQVSRQELAAQVDEVQELAGDKAGHEFERVLRRFTYLRKFTPAVLRHVTIHSSDEQHPVLAALQTLMAANEANARRLPADATTEFVPAKLRALVAQNGTLNKPAWECALLLAMRDEIRAGNLSVTDSKRFGQFDCFFVPCEEWDRRRSEFFQRADLPKEPVKAIAYLRRRLNHAFDEFLEANPGNAFATVDEEGWHLSVDAADKLTTEEEQNLEHLKSWLAKHRAPHVA